MRHLTHPAPVVRDLGLLAARIILGVVLMAHGWQKFSEWGISGTAANFEKMGVPAPTLSALFAAVVEFAGGIALVLGILTPVVALLVVLDMAGAFLSSTPATASSSARAAGNSSASSPSAASPCWVAPVASASTP